MQMEFNTDRQMRDAIYDCVKLLADTKRLPIYAKATGKGVGDNCYHLTLADQAVLSYIVTSRLSTNVVTEAEFIVKVPYDIFDAESKQYLSNDSKFGDDENVSKIYGRIGQLIYKR